MIREESYVMLSDITKFSQLQDLTLVFSDGFVVKSVELLLEELKICCPQLRVVTIYNSMYRFEKKKQVYFFIY